MLRTGASSPPTVTSIGSLINISFPLSQLPSVALNIKNRALLFSYNELSQLNCKIKTNQMLFKGINSGAKFSLINHSVSLIHDKILQVGKIEAFLEL
jgi:hypothetical protein